MNICIRIVLVKFAPVFTSFNVLHIQTHIYTQAHTRTRTHTRTLAHTPTRTHPHTSTSLAHTRTHTHAHTCIHIHKTHRNRNSSLVLNNCTPVILGFSLYNPFRHFARLCAHISTVKSFYLTDNRIINRTCNRKRLQTCTCTSNITCDLPGNRNKVSTHAYFFVVGTWNLLLSTASM